MPAGRRGKANARPRRVPPGSRATRGKGTRGARGGKLAPRPQLRSWQLAPLRRRDPRAAPPSAPRPPAPLAERRAGRRRGAAEPGTYLALPPGRSGGPAPRARSPRGVLGLFVFFFRKPRSEASLPPGMYISYCTVWEGHDLARCRRFPGINPSSPFPSCNLLRMAPRAHAERHTAARTHTRSAARERSGAPDGAVIGRAARGEGDVSSRSHDFSSVWNHL